MSLIASWHVRLLLNKDRTITCILKLPRLMLGSFFSDHNMTYFDQIVYDGKFKEVEELIFERIISLDDLSEMAFLIFKTWAEG